MISLKLLGAFIIILVAYYYPYYTSNELDDVEQEKKDIVEAWQQIVKVPEANFHRICVGTNANVDLIVRGTELLKALGIEPGTGNDRKELATLEDLQQTFHYFFKKGAGAERSFTSSEVFKQIIQTAASLKSAEWYIGGNAALMAQTIATTYQSLKVELVGPVGPRLLKLLDGEVGVATRVQDDEVHLIMEFHNGETWGNSIAPVATRFITSHDIANGEMRPLPDLFASIKTFKADLLIFSGLHLLDSQTDALCQQKLDEVVRHLQKVDRSLPVHLELASMAKDSLVKAIVEKVIIHVTSLGLNEQELTSISYLMNGPHAGAWNNGQQPQVHEVADILLWLLSQYGSDKVPGSRLSRVHFHSLTFHLVAVLPHSWSNSHVAVAMGTQIAGLKACDQKTFHLNDVHLRFPRSYRFFSDSAVEEFYPKKPVVTRLRDGMEFSLSPVLVCRDPLKTVGLGDAISSTGIIHSEYSYPPLVR